MKNSLQDFKDELAKELYSMTTEEAIEKNLCIQCKQLPKFYSQAGLKEYQISGLCEYCFDSICKEPNE